MIPQNKLEDREISDAALYDPRVLSFEITPDFKQGWVTLRGTVDNLRAQISAEKLAENTTGVQGVTNRIKVQTDKWVTDSEMKKNSNTALAEKSNTEAWEVIVDVHNGIVTLSGVVDSYLEKTEAEWVAANETGINDVNNQLSIHYHYAFYWCGYCPHYNLYYTPEATMSSLIPGDKSITRSVRNDLWWSPYVDRDQVTVIMENGKVTLKGKVDSWKENQKAAENVWQGDVWSFSSMLVDQQSSIL